MAYVHNQIITVMGVREELDTTAV